MIELMHCHAALPCAQPLLLLLPVASALKLPEYARKSLFLILVSDIALTLPKHYQREAQQPRTKTVHASGLKSWLL